MSNFQRFLVHVFTNAAVQAAVLALVPAEPWQRIAQLVFLVVGLSAAYVDQGAPSTQ